MRSRRPSPFLVATLTEKPLNLQPLDPALSLPDRRLIRAGAPGVSAPAVAAAGRPAVAQRARFTGRTTPAAPAAAEAKLEITVVNGDLTFEERPLMVGHYRATQLTGTEAVIDSLLDHAMTNALDLGVYPVEPGSQRIFINRHVPKGKLWHTPRPEAVIVVGLGQEGKLQSAHIIHSVRQAVIAWAERVAESEHGAEATGDRHDPAGERRHRSQPAPGGAAHRAGRVRSQRADPAVGGRAAAAGRRSAVRRAVL